MKRQDHSRREFFKKSSLSGISVLTLGNNLGYETGVIESEDAKMPDKKIYKIAGLSLEKLRDKYRVELFENFIPNMDKYAIDHEYGGVMCSLDALSQFIHSNA